MSSVISTSHCVKGLQKRCLWRRIFSSLLPQTSGGLAVRVLRRILFCRTSLSARHAAWQEHCAAALSVPASATRGMSASECCPGILWLPLCCWCWKRVMGIYDTCCCCGLRNHMKNLKRVLCVETEEDRAHVGLWLVLHMCVVLTGCCKCVCVVYGDRAHIELWLLVHMHVAVLTGCSRCVCVETEEDRAHMVLLSLVLHLFVVLMGCSGCVCGDRRGQGPHGIIVTCAAPVCCPDGMLWVCVWRQKRTGPTWYYCHLCCTCLLSWWDALGVCVHQCVVLMGCS